MCVLVFVCVCVCVCGWGEGVAKENGMTIACLGKNALPLFFAPQGSIVCHLYLTKYGGKRRLTRKY